MGNKCDESKIELEKSVEKIYRVFSKYELGEKVKFCPCCENGGERHPIHVKPLRQLKSKDVEFFINDHYHMNQAEFVSNFKYFLPKYFEIIANDKEWIRGFNVYSALSRLKELDGLAGEEYQIIFDIFMSLLSNMIQCAKVYINIYQKPGKGRISRRYFGFGIIFDIVELLEYATEIFDVSDPLLIFLIKSMNEVSLLTLLEISDRTIEFYFEKEQEERERMQFLKDDLLMREFVDPRIQIIVKERFEEFQSDSKDIQLLISDIQENLERLESVKL